MDKKTSDFIKKAEAAVVGIDSDDERVRIKSAMFILKAVSSPKKASKGK